MTRACLNSSSFNAVPYIDHWPTLGTGANCDLACGQEVNVEPVALMAAQCGQCDVGYVGCVEDLTDPLERAT